MPKPIDVATVEARLRDLAAGSVNQTVALFKGGIFALAAVILVDIVFMPDDRLVRIVLWTSSVFAAMTSYNAWLNSTITLFREGIGNLAAMIAQGMIELMAFATLTPRPAVQSWRFWMVATAAFFLVTALRLATRMNRGVRVEAALQPLLELVEKRRHITSRGLFATAVLGAALSVPVLALPKTSPYPEWICLAFSALTIPYACFGLYQQQQERTEIERMLDGAAKR